jgi:hypothetical protein
MTRKTKDSRKTKKETRAASEAVDDRHLSHPHAEPVDPAGGAVFDDATGPTAVSGKPSAENPTAEGDPDAIGFSVLGEQCTEPDDDDGNGVGAVVEDDCDPPAAGSTTTATAASVPVTTTAAAATPSGASTSTGLGSAVLPDGRKTGAGGSDEEIREGFGLVFSE